MTYQPKRTNWWRTVAIIFIALVAIGAAVWSWRRNPVVVHRTIHSVVNPSVARTIDELATRLKRANARYDSSQRVTKRLQIALARISLKNATPAVLDSVRTVLVPPGPKTDTTYCIDLAEARDLYEIKAKEPIKDALIREHQATADSLHADLVSIQVGVDSLKRLNHAKDSIAMVTAETIEDLEDKLDRPFSFGPHAGWDIRNQPTIGLSVQYSLFRFRLWKKKK